ncbi:hypothetical protein [Actinophytocola sp.]|uniref:hypothetical protein n=1 Tax=Actinophytocola sp. TaxID=1872138 RepID=UPI002D7EB1C7|nr:hypothetical protein [Actinophytocola sp.]HET9143934.1 hypothetical protein [Actinophytocola sp.]
MNDLPTRRPVLGRIIDSAKAEPVATQGLIQATLALLIGFGVISWTSEQTGLALALTAAILTFLARRRVTPTTRVPTERPPDLS